MATNKHRRSSLSGLANLSGLALSGFSQWGLGDLNTCTRKERWITLHYLTLASKQLVVQACGAVFVVRS